MSIALPNPARNLAGAGLGHSDSEKWPDFVQGHREFPFGRNPPLQKFPAGIPGNF